jgi:anti-sigma factor RsiW
VSPDDFRSPAKEDEDRHPFLLPWHAADTLDAWTARRIEEHLAGCAPCRAELEALSSMAATLRRHAQPGHLDAAALFALAGDAPPDKSPRPTALREHLAACDACREDLDALRRARQERGASDDEPGTPAAAKRSDARPGPGRDDPWRWAFLAAAATVVVLAVPALRGLRPPVEPPVAREVTPIRLMAATRSEAGAAALQGPGPWVIEVVLPFGAPDGEYRIAIGPPDAASRPMLEMRAHATADGRLTLLLPSLPGDGSYRVRATSAADPGTTYDYPLTRIARPDGPAPPPR